MKDRVWLEDRIDDLRRASVHVVRPDGSYWTTGLVSLHGESTRVTDARGNPVYVVTFTPEYVEFLKSATAPLIWASEELVLRKRFVKCSLAYFVASFLFFGRAIGNAITI